MIEYGQNIPTGTALKTEVCIIGSGAAGVTTAWFLQEAGIDVILIDGSRDLPEAPYEDKILLDNGTSVGLFKHNEPEFLIRPQYAGQSGPKERERTYGGTTTHWGGQSRPLDPITFEGVPGYDGWPITRDELDPYYKQAMDYCKLVVNDFTAPYWAKVLNAEVPKLENFNTEMYQFMGSNNNNLNFAARTINGKTIGDTDVRVIRNASLLEIVHRKMHATEIRVGSITQDGNPPSKATEFTIQAKAYVLATGAVSNARQLLLSNIPNDNIGKYFMCHPLVAGYLDGQPNPITTSSDYINDAEKRLMGGKKEDGDTWHSPEGAYVEGRFIPDAAATRKYDIGRCWFWAPGVDDLYTSTSNVYFEQAPNEKSRVTLSKTEKDPVFGQPWTHIDWQFNDLDEKTYKTTTDLFKKAVQKLKPGATVTCAPWDEIKSRVVVNGHHLGTARMSTSRNDGVVDKNLCCHDVDNLYVAGSSAWRSAGISNPTFTIITFAIRLAEHLKNRVSKK